MLVKIGSKLKNIASGKSSLSPEARRAFATMSEQRSVDFGRTAQDYAQHRPGLPQSFYDAIEQRGWIKAGQRALDLGTGTGLVARGLSARGLQVTGLDPSEELLAVARNASDEDSDLSYVKGVAEDTGMESSSFDVVTAAQCWWWFSGDRAAQEIHRILKPGGRIIAPCFSYLPLKGNLAWETERIILKFNPGWPKANNCGIFPDIVRDFDGASFQNVDTFSYVETIEFTRESWRGRMRTCNGVGAFLQKDAVAQFDAELEDLLSHKPEVLHIPHRIFVVSGIST